MLNFAQIPLLNKNTYFDDDFQAWLNRGSTLGYSLPSYPQQISLNNFVIGLKDAGIWTKWDVLYFYAIDGDEDQALLNFINPLVNKGFNQTSTFTQNLGFTINANGGIDTYNPTTGTKYTLNDCNRSFYLLNSATAFNESLDGTRSGVIPAPTWQFNNHTSAIAAIKANAGANFTGTSIVTGGTGYKALTRTSSTEIKIYLNTTEYTRTQASTSISNVTHALGVRNGINNQGTTHAFFGMGSKLTATEHAALRTLIINTLP